MTTTASIETLVKQLEQVINTANQIGEMPNWDVEEFVIRIEKELNAVKGMN